MGGNALSQPGIRLEHRHYFALQDCLMEKLERNFPQSRWAIIPAYRNKMDFGDMDILCANPPNPDTVALILEAVETHSNGSVTSYGVPVGKLFQVDLIKVPERSFDFALRYFAFNDLGNLIGRVAHRQGLKFGHLGLRYVLRHPDQPERMIREIDVTQNWNRTLEFLGYNPEKYASEYRQGFHTLEDVFQFAASSTHFDSSAYLLGNISHRMRTRDRKRPTYMRFLRWLEKHHPPGKAPSKEASAQILADRLDDAFSMFPVFRREHKELLALSERNDKAKARLNGGLVSKWTGLKGKELGAFMAELSSPFSTKDDFHAFILTLKDVHAWVMRTRT